MQTTYQPLRPILISPDTPQHPEWHIAVRTVVEAVPLKDGCPTHDYLQTVLEGLRIRGNITPCEFRGYDYRYQTWLTIRYAQEVLPLARKGGAVMKQPTNGPKEPITRFATFDIAQGARQQGTRAEVEARIRSGALRGTVLEQFRVAYMVNGSTQHTGVWYTLGKAQEAERRFRMSSRIVYIETRIGSTGPWKRRE